MWISGVILAVSAVVCMGPAAWALHRAQWVAREPVAAVIVWQVIGVASGVWLLSAGILAALSSVQSSLLLHVSVSVACALLLLRLLWLTLRSGTQLLRAQRDHTHHLDLLTTPLPQQRGVTLLDVPYVAVYSVPGSQQRVVVTSGALSVLNRDEVACAVAHEFAHCEWRHDILLWPFTAWRCAWPRWVVQWFPGASAADAVRVLAEMIADDAAVLHHNRRVLARAVTLCALGQHTPHGAYALSESAVEQRVHRLLEPPTPSRVWRWVGRLSPLSVLLVPLFAVSVGAVYG